MSESDRVLPDRLEAEGNDGSILTQPDLLLPRTSDDSLLPRTSDDSLLPRASDTVDSPPPPTGGGRRAIVLNGGLWSAASQLIPALGTAVLSVAAGRLLGAGPLGQQSLIAYVNAALSALLVVSLNTALVQVGGRLQGARDVVALRRLMRWAITAHLVAGAVVAAAMIVGGEVTGSARLAWAVIGVVSILDAAADGLTIRLIITEGWAPVGRLRLGFQLIGPFLGVGFVLAGAGITGIFVGDGLAALGLLIATGLRFRRLGRETSDRALLGGADPLQAPKRRPRPYPVLDERVGELPRGLRAWRPPVPVLRVFLLFTVGQLIAQVVSKRVEFVVLAIFAGNVAVGIYSVTFMAVSLLSMVPLGIATAAMPMIAAAEGRGDIAPAVRHLRYALRLGTALTIPLAALLAAAGPFAVLAVYGESYREAARLVPLASLALLPAVVGGVCTQFWSGRARLGIVLRAGGFAAAVDLAVALTLVPLFGTIGAVVANVTAQFALSAALLLSTVRELGPIGWRLRGLFDALGVGAAAAAAPVLVWLGVDAVLPAGLEVRAVVITVLGGVFGLLAATGAATVVKLFDDDEGSWVESMLPGRLRGAIGRVTRSTRTRPAGAHRCE